MDFKDLKIRSLTSDCKKNRQEFFKEWYDEQQPKERCDMIKGHDNYWEGKIEEIKKVIDDTPQYALQNDFEKALNKIKKIVEEA